MKRIGAALAIWAVMCVGASAQTPNPVMQHYRAYQAALAADDLAAAEGAAAAALEASEARDGDGGRTGVLALNLATVRFLNGDAAGALAPGQRALGLAQSRGEASGVPLPLAQLIVGRAQLAVDYDRGAPRLREALEAAQASRLAPEEIYDASVELGQQSFARGQFDAAVEAYAIAASFAEGARFPRDFALGRARVGQAAAMLMESVASNARGRLSQDAGDEARGHINEALNLLRPLAEAESPNRQLTLAQRAYAESLAWQGIVRAKMRSDGLRLSPLPTAEGDADGAREIDVPSAVASTPRCLLDFEYRGSFPARALDDGAIAGVAVLISVDQRGEVTNVETVSIVGREEFARSLNNSTRLWRASRAEGSQPNCRMQMRVLRSVSFTFGNVDSVPPRLR